MIYNFPFIRRVVYHYPFLTVRNGSRETIDEVNCEIYNKKILNQWFKSLARVSKCVCEHVSGEISKFQVLGELERGIYEIYGEEIPI